MGQALRAGIVTFEDTGWTRERLLDDLSNERTLPVAAVNIAVQFPAEIEEAVAAVLRRALTEKLDRPSDRLLFRGIHILGSARSPTIYRTLVDFLHGPEQVIEELGDATTETLSPIIAGLFDGDTSLLKALITDINADEYVRNAAFGALAFLTFDGRIARDEAVDFLRRFGEEDRSQAGNLVWDGWMEAVGLLGLDELTPLVHAAFEDGRIPSILSDERHYCELLENALRDPNDPQRFRREFHGYIEDAAHELSKFSAEQPEGDTGPLSRAIGDVTRGMVDRMSATRESNAAQTPYGQPFHNPYKGVGRNDPCPCGSGKKFKKCCGTGG
jgi:Protein of unknown function (DUF1186)/SEC-C motif